MTWLLRYRSQNTPPETPPFRADGVCAETHQKTRLGQAKRGSEPRRAQRAATCVGWRDGGDYTDQNVLSSARLI
jgi:hypothetical protein